MSRMCGVYILTNKYKTVLYTGVTSNLMQRIFRHKTKAYPKSFSARYNVDRLVYFEAFDSIMDAIQREKQIKAGSRQNKVDLIDSMNPDWIDLFEDLSQTNS